MKPEQYIFYQCKYKAGDTGGRWGSCKKKIGKHENSESKGKKERISKQKLLKGCHQGQNVAVLAILERLEIKNFFLFFKYFPVFHVPSTLKSISPALKY